MNNAANKAVRDTHLNTLVRRHTAFDSTAQLLECAKTGYVPSIFPRGSSGALNAEKLTLVRGLVERGCKVFTG